VGDPQVNDTLAPSARHEGDALASAVAKVKRHVLPLFVIMFIVNYLDRVNIGFVRPHLESDLGISAAAFGFGAGLFFIGYALFEVPSNMLLQKVGARLWLTRIMFTWGLVATAMAFVAVSARGGRSRLLSWRDLLLHPLAAGGRARQGDCHLPQWLGAGFADFRAAGRGVDANPGPGPAWLAVDAVH